MTAEFSEVAILNGTENVNVIYNQFFTAEDMQSLDVQSGIATDRINCIVDKNVKEIAVDDVLTIANVDYTVYKIEYFDQYLQLCWLTVNESGD